MDFALASILPRHAHTLRPKEPKAKVKPCVIPTNGNLFFSLHSPPVTSGCWRSFLFLPVHTLQLLDYQRAKPSGLRQPFAVAARIIATNHGPTSEAATESALVGPYELVRKKEWIRPLLLAQR